MDDDDDDDVDNDDGYSISTDDCKLSIRLQA